MTFHVQFSKCHTIMSAYHVTCGIVKKSIAHGTLVHAIEQGQVKGSHMTLNVQHKNLFNYTRGHHVSWEGKKA